VASKWYHEKNESWNAGPVGPNNKYSNYFFSIEIDIPENEKYKKEILAFLRDHIKLGAKTAEKMAEGPVRVKAEYNVYLEVSYSIEDEFEIEMLMMLGVVCSNARRYPCIWVKTTGTDRLEKKEIFYNWTGNPFNPRDFLT